MTEGTMALGAPKRVEALDVLRDYEALHAAVQQLIELGQASKAYADPTVVPMATATELHERLRDLKARFDAAFAELARIDAELAARRRAVLREPPENTERNLH